MPRFDADVEAGLQQSNGFVNPFMVTAPPVYTVAFHDFEDKTLAECKTEYDRMKAVVRKVIDQGVNEDGNLDLEKVDVFAGNTQEKAEKLMEIHSRMAGVDAAMRPKLEKERQAEALRLGIIQGNTGGGTVDANGKPARIRPSDRVESQLQEQGMSLANLPKGQIVSVGWEAPMDIDGREFMAATFETDDWQPDITRQPGWVPSRTRPLQVYQILPMMMVGKDAVTWMEETTYTNAAAEAAENAQVAESAYELTERREVVERIAHYLPITEEALADEPQLRGYIDYVMPTGVRQRLDGQVLNGTGAGSQITGILAYNGTPTKAGTVRHTGNIQRRKFTRTSSIDGDIVKPWNVLLNAAYDIEDHGMGILGMQSPSHAVLHPRFYLQCLLSESSSGGYYVGGPQSPMLDMAWGMQVVKTTHLVTTATSADGIANFSFAGIVGDFSPLFITLYMRHDVRTEIGYIADDFRRFKQSIRSSIRCALAMRRAEAFVGLVNPLSTGVPPADS